VYVQTYSKLRCLGVVLLLGIETLVNEAESACSASTELGLHAEDCDALLLNFQYFRKFLLDLGFCQGAHVRVDDFNGLIAVKVGCALTTWFLAKRGFFWNLRT
jgi:hypothetical protein